MQLCSIYPQASPISSKNPRKGGSGFGGAHVFEVGAVCRVLSLAIVLQHGYDDILTVLNPFFSDIMFNQMDNSLIQTPCVVASYLAGVCVTNGNGP